ncbi:MULTISPECIES: hypothetical protein [unclassified Mesorhizobium]|nr:MULTISPECIES: hypothetical protein [unclassified Mesorhizobium]MCA0004085.1 hypothetical protein [Mesorhizobium sp. B264B2A]MCA0010388.1 hypothetical protein [Mesorhizobium sp. B264B1B]MCA0016489.1 hypothetical protein [Mesorhizobium sp. B294B1A1]MCA0035492.1 hypothetical protein [Mesorhizobium sp. B263B2A]
MTSQIESCLGILGLEPALPPGVTPPAPPSGSLFSSATFDFPVISETVEGAWADVVMLGEPALQPAFVTAARRLVERGAVVITSDCGSAVRHQAAVAAAVSVPVVMSSLLLVPTLLRQLPPKAKLAVVTADSRVFRDDLLGLSDQADRDRIVIGGIEGGKILENASMRPPQPTDIADIENDVAACVARLRGAHPEIAALLFTCTGFPPITPAIRRMTGLPIYDITTICRMTLEALGA